MKHEAKRRRFPAGLLLAAVLLLTAALAGLYGWHHIRLRKEARILESRGYCYAAADGGYALSCFTSGNDAGAHRIIAISGMGISDASIQYRTMCGSLSEDNLFVCIDRAGYGLSNDTKIPQTVQQIVSDYRTALKNANIEPPYVLLPYAEGGVYAAYWESLYPDEIAGVCFLDGTCLSDVQPEPVPTASLRAAHLFAAFGAARLSKAQLPVGYSAAEQQYARFLRIRSTASSAQISETELFPENCKTAYDSLVQNDIPKLYINTGMRYTEDAVKPYLEQLGSCEYLVLTSDSAVYMQKPMQCAVLLTRFLSGLDAS